MHEGSVYDLERSLALWDLYRGPAQLKREGKWVDRASKFTGLSYVLLASALSDILAARGDTARATKIAQVGRTVMETARIDNTRR
jgi:hypothetical protein